MIELQYMLVRIKKICKVRNISYKQLSEMTGISISTLGKIMAGIIKDPSITSILKIATALNVTIDYLIFGEKPKTEIKQEPKQYDNLNETGKQKVDDFISDLLYNPKYTAADERPHNSISDELRPLFKQAIQSMTDIKQK